MLKSVSCNILQSPSKSGAVFFLMWQGLWLISWKKDGDLEDMHKEDVISSDVKAKLVLAGGVQSLRASRF